MKKAARSKTKTSCQVVVVGSLNLDYITRVEHLPRPGETIVADKMARFRGGKGANQAIAAARQGCEVTLVGAVGFDEGGDVYRRVLEDEGIHTDYLRTAPTETGSAFITVDHQGENVIVIAPGANADLRRSDIARSAPAIEACAVLLGQFEVPTDTLVEAARIANQSKTLVVINPSPYLWTFPWEEIRTDVIVVNETEAEALLGFRPEPSAASEVRKRLHELHAESLVVTRGGDETLAFTREGESFSIPVLSVLPVDTVGAGDAFSGCLAARLAQGETLRTALRAANCAGALTTLGAGAQDPIPNRAQVDRHLQFLDL
ncbi:MAG: ribokinase [Verrucomicrobiales bacterium]|nr:ribokinase [Verrucomicrobiales bacterium]